MMVGTGVRENYWRWSPGRKRGLKDCQQPRIRSIARNESAPLRRYGYQKKMRSAWTN